LNLDAAILADPDRMNAVSPQVEPVDHGRRRVARHADRLEADDDIGHATILQQRHRLLHQRDGTAERAVDAAQAVAAQAPIGVGSIDGERFGDLGVGPPHPGVDDEPVGLFD
jgi:hypothetical protein